MDSRFSRPRSGLDRSRPSGLSDSGLAGSGANPLCCRLTGATTRNMAIRDPLVLQALEIIAVLTGTLFAGAALYINAVEHPARMLLDTKSAALQWAPSYKRATFVQAPLALISFACGSLAWLSGGSIWWLVAALLIGAVVPFTFIVVMPTNHRLLAPDRDLSSIETRQLLQKWAMLHAVRTFLGLAASIIYVWLLREA